MGDRRDLRLLGISVVGKEQLRRLGWDELLRGDRYRDHGIQSLPNALLSCFLPVESVSVARLVHGSGGLDSTQVVLPSKSHFKPIAWLGTVAIG